MNALLIQALTQKLGLPPAVFLEETTSTNDEALRLAEAGAPDETLVVADYQTRGRGRMGRSWITRKGSALAFSLVLRPRSREEERLELFSPLGALSVASALEDLGLQPQVKWPNDVLLNRRKVCGILVEASWTGERLTALVVGIGVNVAPSAVPPDEWLIYPATSVEEITGHPVDRMAVLEAILLAFRRWRHELGSDHFMKAWQERLAFLEEEVVVQPPGQSSLRGRLLGVDGEGNLRLQLAGGEEIKLAAGDINLRPVT
ncbi:MAG TPA: biotin--[acetyl-CoA-carboxylase] ligase [Anaerolinea thermolimosa]|uniref:biotin--[biotin carboxyl-carrier protein] ligase n=1 Tax=Anaerolinea thermolimosa TaxID=229919 RepID=A0A3D1JFG7_9CHLR|nr:biotin--[acetyl-CoA-carboxylase] ligase [Anaerolinea thermolimosa]GAP07265.1 birA, biotin-[acetyl-CoA-carboxylase] ligase region [Anaerolinea thermolimosa]HCE17233.1 biotin--[acetyl-CoA-carboxylase] ligase [Anaerolinea thermolimosa]